MFIIMNCYRINQSNDFITFTADAHITEEETEALLANNTTSMFVGNVSEKCYSLIIITNSK